MGTSLWPEPLIEKRLPITRWVLRAITSLPLCWYFLNVYLHLKDQQLNWRLSCSYCHVKFQEEPLEMVNVFVFHTIETSLLSAWNFCHFSLVEMLSEHCVRIWFLNRKFCLDKGRSFGEVVTMVLQNYKILLWNGQWKVLLNSIFSNGCLQ